MGDGTRSIRTGQLAPTGFSRGAGVGPSRGKGWCAVTPKVQTGTSDTDTSLGRLTILLVDDDERWARVTSRLLEEHRDSFVVETAHSFAAGRDRFLELDPDCVVCDYELGDGTGLTMLEAVREVDPDRPFILVTGRGSETVASDAIGRGVTDYIRKDHDDDEADLLASRITNAVRSYRTEQALERERRSKDAMLDIMTATTARADLSQQFCTQLVEDRAYDCAWIGTRDGAGSVVPEASAGRDEYLDEVTALDPTVHSDEEPSVAALARNEPVVVAPLQADGDGEDWSTAAVRCGFESAAALPIRHDGVRFGALTVYASSPTTIDDRERRFLEEYAETVGYALRTAEWKRSLLSEHPVSIDVEVADPTAPLVAFVERAGPDARLEVLSAIDRGDGTTLYLARAEGLTPERIRDYASEGEELRLADLEGTGSPVRCEFVVDSPTPETLLADHGARFERTVIERGTATVTALVPDDGTVPTLASALEERYDETGVSTIWSDRTARSGFDQCDPMTPLTDRQREVIRHAFHDGYFDLPRGTSATELAEKFDIARATLTQHLRSAQRKLLSQLLSR